jgi:F-box/leucine-rich repeat protein 14
MLDGPFSDLGLAKLTTDGLAGLFGLNLFWHVRTLSSDALAALARLEQLEMLGCKGELCDDRGMRHIAAIPRLRVLMGQGAVAHDDGFVALSKSRSIEYIWGRKCENLKGRGFAALADMPALRGLGVSCKKVDDKSLAALSRFPALEQLMPMDVTDDGFRHVGRCEKLINLWCMYCRETGDEATRHLADLTQLRSYYAGNTRITDASLAMLGRLASLESIELWEIARITDAGVAHLATLPRLREVGISGSPRVTRNGMGVFPVGVKVSYST